MESPFIRTNPQSIDTAHFLRRCFMSGTKKKTQCWRQEIEINAPTSFVATVQMDTGDIKKAYDKNIEHIEVLERFGDGLLSLLFEVTC